MFFEEGHIYHVFNRSNEPVFYSERNYLFFIGKIRKLIYPVCEILAWNLMPNHFHFLLQATRKSVTSTDEKHRPALKILSKNFGTLLSSYALAINKENHRRGKLFAQSTKAKPITHMGNNYIENCFHYIHQNPLNARLVKRIEDWPYSSFPDYAGLRKGTLCNKDLAFEMMNLNRENFLEQAYAVIEEKGRFGFLPSP